MSKYQVLCYCSLAKPDPCTKSKTLVSQDRYGIVFMHGQNVMADISTRSQSFHFDLRLCILILGHCLVSQQLSLQWPEFWPSHHDARKEGGNTGLAHTASAMRQEPWHIVASTTLNNSATWVSYNHRSIPFSTPLFHPISHSSDYRDT